MRGWLRVKGASRISAAIRHSVASWTATPRPQRIAVQHDGGALPFQKADGRPPVLIKPGLAWFAGIAGISPVLRLINAVARVDQVAQDMRASTGFRHCHGTAAPSACPPWLAAGASRSDPDHRGCEP